MIASVPGGVRSYKVNGLTEGKLYSFKIEACDKNGNLSTNGPIVTFMMPSKIKIRRGFSYTYPMHYGDWANGFMAGNGKQGVIVFGDPVKDTIIYTDRGFNLASTTPRYFNKVSVKDLQQIKNYLVNEQWKEANDLADKVHGWRNGGEGNRHPGYMGIIRKKRPMFVKHL